LFRLFRGKEKEGILGEKKPGSPGGESGETGQNEWRMFSTHIIKKLID
jgi:hypothetical protein